MSRVRRIELTDNFRRQGLSIDDLVGGPSMGGGVRKKEWKK